MATLRSSILMKRIDELAELRAKLRAARIILAHIPHTTVSLYDTHERCIIASVVPDEKAHGALGYDRGHAFEGRTLTEAITPTRLPRVLSCYRKALAGETVTVDFPVSEALFL